ncbi:MAG: DUF3089 domain-containing protein [Solirubrobacterales bacterium]
METSSRTRLIRFTLAAVTTSLGLAFFAGPVAAGSLEGLGVSEETVWLCKPGQADNPCGGTLAGSSFLPPDTSVNPPLPIRTEPLTFTAASKSPVDCFYLYPTQSAQPGPNADLAKDQAIRGVAINQARMFSRICDVYAPVYRQYTLDALDGPISDEVRDIAYNSARGAWNDYMDNYNRGRGVVVIAHSQGTSHMARLLAEEVDDDPAVRSRIISAILPGANVFVPKGGVVGGQFQNIPACEADNQLGCVIAFSMFKRAENQRPPDNSSFGWVDTGYWINPAPRPDKDLYEVMCVNPGELSGDDGVLSPLANLPAFVALPEGNAPWQEMPDFYKGQCRTETDETKGNVSWLNIEDIRQPGDNRQDITQLVISSGGNLHTADINLALGNLIDIAATQSRVYVADQRSKVVARRVVLRRQLNSAEARSSRLSAKARKASRSCSKQLRSCGQVASLRQASAKASRRVKSLKKAERRLTVRINALVGPLDGLSQCPSDSSASSVARSSVC